MMAEEQRCEEGHRLCANNCGFFGSPATRNLCSKCYGDFRLKEEHAAAAASSSFSSAFSPSSSTSSSFHVAAVGEAAEATTPSAPPPAAAASPEEAAPLKPAASRCASCRKRVGLTGFTCRCGSTFCGTHRYSQNHACTFDFKAAGRDAIARANPVIKADKLHKI